MRYIVAVSGGIDSVVLLHQLVAANEHELIIAHFDHGIRAESADDAQFVHGLAKKYGLPYETRREELGELASEETARRRRYVFLREVARKYDGMIATAHHSDDVIETIAINLSRGTGWRGVAVLDNDSIFRPLLQSSKAVIREYALDNRLEWVEDGTNDGVKYLRNRIRRSIAMNLSMKQKDIVLGVWQEQIVVKREIENELLSFTKQAEYSRYLLTNIDQGSAAELLRAIIVAQHGISPTRPQLVRALLAIKTAQPSSTHDIGDGRRLRFRLRTFIVETP